MLRHLHIHSAKIDSILTSAPRSYHRVNIDVSNNCNLRCAYCPSFKADGFIDRSKLVQVLRDKVQATRHLFYGCGLEPTLHPDLERLLLLGGKYCRPTDHFALVTNGILLNRLSPNAFRDAGGNYLVLSIDSVNASTMKRLRGADLDRILDNVERFRKGLPELTLQFTAVATSINIDELEDLVRFAIDFGVQRVAIRNVSTPRGSAMEQKLGLQPEQIETLRERLSVYADRILIIHWSGELQFARA